MVRKYGVVAGLVSVAFGLGVYVGHGVPAAAQRAPRVLELRRYTANEGKLDALVKRMRDGESKLFEKHGMKGVFYSVAADAPESKNTFVYLLMHDSREAAMKSWDAFRADPEWTSLKATSEANGVLVSKAEVLFLNPTDFSPTK